MDENRLRGLIGLCVRARQATFGMDGCLKAVRSGGCGLLLLDETASAATMDKYMSACRTHGTTAALLPEGLVAEATGRSGVAAAIAPGGLADQLKRFPGLKIIGGADHELTKEIHCGGAYTE